MLTGDLFQQLVGGDIESGALDLRILGREGLGHLAAAGGDGVQRDLAALGDGLFIQFLIRLVCGIDVGGLFPLCQTALAGAVSGTAVVRPAAAAGNGEQHRSGQQKAQ